MIGTIVRIRRNKYIILAENGTKYALPFEKVRFKVGQQIVFDQKTAMEMGKEEQ